MHGKLRHAMVSSAQLRAARAYLDWTMDRAALAAGIHRRTIIRLECKAGYAERQPPSLRQLVAVYREQRVLLEGNGLAFLTADAEAIPPSERPPSPTASSPVSSSRPSRSSKRS